jgi:hypothetical protein
MRPESQSQVDVIGPMVELSDADLEQISAGKQRGGGSSRSDSDRDPFGGPFGFGSPFFGSPFGPRFGFSPFFW